MTPIVPDGEAAVAWYREALGAEVMWDLGGVAGWRCRGAFFLHEANPKNAAEDTAERIGRTSVRIEVFVEDPTRSSRVRCGRGAARLTRHGP